MKAVILAAGIGSRLRPLTANKSKSMVKVAGKPILAHQIAAYKKAGIREISIVVGYEADGIVSDFKYEKEVAITFIQNDDYEVTNNMYSLWLARDFVKDSAFFVSNADVVFSSDILTLHQKNESAIFVDKGLYNEESMKVSIDDEQGLVNHISKTLRQANSYGAAIDVSKFNETDGAKVLSHIDEVITRQEKLKDWVEKAYNDVFESGKVTPQPVDIQGRKWVEIDNYEDLALADKIFSDFDFSLNTYEHFVFDLDGTLFVGDKPIEEAIEKVNLIAKNKEVYFMTNNSSKSKKEYVTKLGEMGLVVSDEQIISSVDNVLHFLKANKVKDVFVLGTKSLQESLLAEDINPHSDQPEYVVVGYDTSLDYQKLMTACCYINKGVDFVATHIDIFCPTPDGAIPDCGAMTKMLEMTTGKKVKYIFGKPSEEMFNSVHLDMKKTVIVGDRIHTDGKLAMNVGADFILVLSGESTRDTAENNIEIPVKLCLKNIGCL